MALLDVISDDLKTVMLEGEFSEPVTIDAGSITEEGVGIFDLTYQEVNAQGVTVQSKSPRVSLFAETWTTALGVEFTDKNAASWVFTIRDVNYKSDKVQPDGTGWVMVYLMRARE